MFLLDTMVISELERPVVNPGVAKWIEGVSWEDLHLSAITVAEIWQGIVTMPAGRKRRQLEASFEMLHDQFGDRILPIDFAVAQRYAELQGDLGPLPILDTLIAASALVHRLTVVTHNSSDLGRTGVPILDPWE